MSIHHKFGDNGLDRIFGGVSHLGATYYYTTYRGAELCAYGG